MNAKMWLLRNSLLELPIEVPEERNGNLKAGKDLLKIELTHEKDLPWYENEVAFFLIENIEIVAMVRAFKIIPESGAITKGRFTYELTLQKVKIKENPILGMHFDKDTGETGVFDPDLHDGGKELDQIIDVACFAFARASFTFLERERGIHINT